MKAFLHLSATALLLAFSTTIGCSDRNLTPPMDTPKGDVPATNASQVSTHVARSVPLVTSAPFALKGGAFVAANRNIFAHVSSDFSLTVTSIDNPHSLQLQPTRIERGTRSLLASGAPVSEGGAVVRHVGSVHERVELRADGAEETWSFDHKPEGAGDLVVHQGARARGEVVVEPHAIRFVSERLRVSEGKWIDARGVETRVPVAYRDGELRFEVSNDVIENSTYPAVLDPTVSNEAEVDPQVVSGPTTQRGSQSSSLTAGTAFDGTNYLVAWTDTRGLRPAIMAARVSQTGTVLDPNGILVSYLPTFSQVSYASGSLDLVIGAPGGFLVTWNLPGFAYSGNPCGAVRVRSDGTVVDSTPLNLPTTMLPLAYNSATENAFFALTATAGALSGLNVNIVRVAGVNDSTTTPVTSIPAFESLSQNAELTIALARDLFFFSTKSGSTWTTFSRRIGVSDFTGSAVATSALPSNIPIQSARFDGTNYVLYGRDFNSSDTALARVATDGKTTVGASVSTPIQAFSFNEGIIAADATGILLRGAKEGVRSLCRYTTALGLISCVNDPVETRAYIAVAPSSYLYASYPNANPVRGAQPTVGLFNRSTHTLATPFTSLSTSSNSQWTPAIVYDKSVDRYVAVWLDDSLADQAVTATTGGIRVIGAVIQSRGETADVGPTFTISVPGGVPGETKSGGIEGISSRPQLVQTSAGLFAIWQENRTNQPTSRIYASKIVASAANTATVAAPVAIVSTNEPVAYPSVAADNSALVVSWVADTQINAKRVPFSASEAEALAIQSITLSNDITSRSRYGVTSVFDGKQTVIVWAETEIFGGRLEGLAIPDGQNIPSTTSFPLVTTFSQKAVPRLASDGETGSLLVWGEGRSDGTFDVMGKFLSRDALRPASTTDAIRIATQFERDEANPAAAYSNDGDSYFVAWGSRLGTGDSDLRGAWVARDGRVLDPEPGVVLSSTTAQAVADANGGKAADAAGEDEGIPSVTTGPISTVGVVYVRLDRRSGYGAARARFRTVNSGLTRGAACSSSDACASRYCVDGVCCDKACDGGCGSCGGAGVKAAPASAVRGVCTPVVAATVCTNEPEYVCGGSSTDCATSCTGSGQGNCAPGFSCFEGKCTTRGSACLDDQTAISATGNLSCGAYRCVDGACLSTCNDVSECTPGNVCDFDGRCTPPPAVENTDGCSTHSKKGTSGIVALLTGVAVLAFTRRRRRGVDPRRYL